MLEIEGKIVAKWEIEKSLLLRFNEELYLRLWIRDERGFSEAIVIPTTAFNDVRSFNNFVGKKGWGFLGSNRYLMELRDLLLDENKLPTEATFFVGSDGVNGWVDWNADNFLDYNHPLKNSLIKKPPECKITKSIIELLLQIHPNSICSILGWFAACPFAVQFREKYENFPLLVVTGEQGSGKTDLVQTLLKMIGWDDFLHSYSESPYVMTRLLSSTNTVPIVFDEAGMIEPPKLDILKTSVKGAKLMKGSWGNGPSQIEMDLQAPVALIGEVSIRDPALIERSLIVELNRGDRISIEKWAEFDRIEKTGMLYEYMKWAVSQKIDESHAIPRDKMGEFVSATGIRMLQKYLRVRRGIHYTFPINRNITTAKIFPADGVLLFLDLLLNLYEYGKTGRWLWARNGILYFQMKRIWGTVQEASRRYGLEIPLQRELNSMLRHRKYATYENKLHPLLKRQIWVWAINKEEVEKIIRQMQNEPNEVVLAIEK